MIIQTELQNGVMIPSSPSPALARGNSSRPAASPPAEENPAELRAECQEWRRRFAAIPRATQHATIRISELEKALLSIRQARDTTLAQLHTLREQLTTAEERVAELELERDGLECAAELARAELEAARRDTEDLRGLLHTKEEQHALAVAEWQARWQRAEARAESGPGEAQRAEELAATRKKLARAEARLKQMQRRLEQSQGDLAARLAAAERERLVSEDRLGELKEEAEQACVERDGLREILEAREQAHAAEIAEAEARAQELESRLAATAGYQAVLEQLAAAERKLAAVDAYFEKTQAQQKQANSTLVEKCVKANQARRAAEQAAREAGVRAEQLAAEQRALRLELAEAQAAVGRWPSQAPRAGGGGETGSELEDLRRQVADLAAELDAARDELRLAWAANTKVDAPVPGVAEGTLAEPAAATIPEPLEGGDAREAVAKMEAVLAVAAVAEQPAEALELLGSELQEFAQRTLCAGSMATYRLVGLCAEVVEWVRKMPARLAPARMLLVDTLSLLGRLAEQASPSTEADVTESAVYVVDDDMDNCECIAMALDKLGLRTRYAAKAELALAQLSAEGCDLVILDVDLGSANGFDVHARLREIPHLRDTPVLFCSALSSAAERVELLAEAQASFLGKPYTLPGLGLKVLGMIVAARLAV